MPVDPPGVPPPPKPKGLAVLIYPFQYAGYVVDLIKWNSKRYAK